MKRTRISTDSYSALFWIVLGVLVCYGATRIGLGSVTDPGSGFVFFWSGLILVILSLVLLAESFREVGAEAPETTGTDWKKIALVLVSLVLYAVFLERLGFVLTTFLLLSFLLGLIGRTNWGRSFLVAGAAAFGSFAIFELWLRIRLPKGFFGF